jgi:hypothetical protein
MSHTVVYDKDQSILNKAQQSQFVEWAKLQKVSINYGGDTVFADFSLFDLIPFEVMEVVSTTLVHMPWHSMVVRIY